MKAFFQTNLTENVKYEKSRLLILLVFLFYLLVAYNSSGFIHPDEHYQIIPQLGSYQVTTVGSLSNVREITGYNPK